MVLGPVIALGAFYGTLMVLSIANVYFSLGTVEITFETAVTCKNYTEEWCFQASIFELDAKSEDEVVIGKMICSQNKTMVSQMEGERLLDGVFDTEYEFMIKINHTCNEDEFEKVAWFHYPHVPVSNQKYVFKSNIVIDNLVGFQGADFGETIEV